MLKGPSSNTSIKVSRIKNLLQKPIGPKSHGVGKLYHVGPWSSGRSQIYRVRIHTSYEEGSSTEGCKGHMVEGPTLEGGEGPEGKSGVYMVK